MKMKEIEALSYKTTQNWKGEKKSLIQAETEKQKIIILASKSKCHEADAFIKVIFKSEQIRFTAEFLQKRMLLIKVSTSVRVFNICYFQERIII